MMRKSRSPIKHRGRNLFHSVRISLVIKLILLAVVPILVFDFVHEKKDYDKTSTVATDESSKTTWGSFSLFSNSTMMDTTGPMSVGTQIGAMLGYQKEIENEDPLGLSLRMGTGEESKIFGHSRDVLVEPGQLELARDIPFFWVIPKSGTSTVKSIMARCLNLRKASSTGQVNYDSYNKLELVDLGDDKGGQFVNVDFGYLPGVNKAKEWNMADSGLVDVAVTSYLHEAVTEVFSPSHQARIFTTIRHPVQRLISAFHYQKIAVWEKTFDGSRDTNITLLEYATDSQYHVDNWMTRMLSNRHDGPVKAADVVYAQKVLKEKILILMLDDMEEGMARLLAFMNWGDRLIQTTPTGLSGNECIGTYLNSKRVNVHHDGRDAPVTMDSEEWRALESISKYDLNLYWYAKDLYDGEQKELYDKIRVV